MNTEPRNYKHLVYFILIIISIQLIGWFITLSSITTWYPTLVKPSWNPPDWVFGPIWTILYFMIAVSGWIIYEAPPFPERSRGLFFYWIQLFLNAIWSFFFFYLQKPLWSLLDIIFLTMTIYFTIRSFWVVDRLAAALLIPYFIWICFATSLNVAIWFLNLP